MDELEYLKEHHHATETAIGLATSHLHTGDHKGALAVLRRVIAKINDLVKQKSTPVP